MRKKHIQISVLILFIASACLSLYGFGWGGGTQIGDKPPEIRLPEPGGGQVTLDQQKGKVVVVYFWSDLCSCAERLPKLNSFYRKNRDRGLSMLAVNVGQTKERVSSYLKKNPLEYTVLLDEKKDTAKSYAVNELPTVYIIDRKGKIRQKLVGEFENDLLAKMVTRLL
jgi:peroxiredoxin